MMTFKNIKSIIKENNMDKQEYWEAKMTDKEYIDKLEGLIKYQYAYDILMEYWDSLPDEENQKIDKRLKELDL